MVCCCLFAELPPRPLLEKLARELRRRLVYFHSLSINCYSVVRMLKQEVTLYFCQGLQLFNLDMIREYGTRDNYFVIDINYFPGELTLCTLSCQIAFPIE